MKKILDLFDGLFSKIKKVIKGKKILKKVCSVIKYVAVDVVKEIIKEIILEMIQA